MKEQRLYTEGNFSQIGHGNNVMSVCFVDENTFVSAGWDKNFMIWDTRAMSSQGIFRGLKVSGDALDYKKGRLLVG